MRKKIGLSAAGLLLVAIVLAGLLGVIDTLSGTPPFNVSKPSDQDIEPEGLGSLEKAELLKNISPELSSLPHTPLFDINGSIPSSLLRSTATLNYDGELWNFEMPPNVQDYNGEKINPQVKGFSSKSIENVEVTSMADFGKDLSVLPTSLYPVYVDSPVPLKYLPDDQLFIAESGIPESYSFQAVQYQFNQAILDQAEAALDEKYLQLPPDITDRTRELAEEITSGIESPYQQAQAIQDYLKANYNDNFDYAPAPVGQESNDWFLFEEKQGVCTQFNSAFVTLARSVGLPSRLVGGYAVNPGVDSQIVYADQAHAWSEVEFQDIGWQTFDATGDPPVSAPTFTDITSVSNTVTKGSSFRVKGIVTSPGTIVEGVLVELFINPKKSQIGGIKIGEGMVAENVFDIEANIPSSENVGNYQLLAHSLNSIRLQESWSDPPIKVTAETMISLDTPTRIKIYDSLTVKGTLTEKTSNPVGGQTVEISINNSTVTRAATDQKGQFVWDKIMTAPGRYSLAAAFNKTEFYSGARQQADVDVLLPAVITLLLPPEAKEGEEVTITGILMEEIQSKPIQSQIISILVNNQPLNSEIKTGLQGDFSFRYTFDKPGIYNIEAISDYTGKYWESRRTAAIEIISVEFQFPWLSLIMFVMAIAVGAGIYMLYRRTRSQEFSTAGRSLNVALSSLNSVVPEDNSPKAIMKIYFPAIMPPFPDVWGVNEELEVFFKLLDPAGRIIARADLKIYLKDREISLITAEDGTARLLLTFPAKGLFSVKAIYAGRDEIRGVTTFREVKIVDYREEIVELFRYIKDWFVEKGLSFPLEATPRELQEIVSASNLGISEDVLVRLVEFFEEADYSLHPVNRESYLRMYLAQREIKESVR